LWVFYVFWNWADTSSQWSWRDASTRGRWALVELEALAGEAPGGRSACGGGW
jgi:hypothetical protein